MIKQVCSCFVLVYVLYKFDNKFVWIPKVFEELRYLFSGSFKEWLSDIFGIIAIVVIISVGLHIPGFI